MSTAETESIKFTDSDDCKSFIYCRTCRDTTSVGRLWRRVVAKRYDVPNIDWPCPHGWKWGGKPGLMLRLKRRLGIGTQFSRTANRFGVRPCGECAKRAARMDGREA